MLLLPKERVKYYLISQLCFYVYVKHFYMKEYLTVRSKSLASLLLDVTIHLELVVEFVCMYQTELLMTSVWHTHPDMYQGNKIVDVSKLPEVE